MERTLLRPLAAAVLLAASSTALATNTAITPTAAQARMIRTYTAMALEHIAQAEGAEHNGKTTDELRNLGEVRGLLNLVRAVRPTGEAKGLLHFVQARMDVEDNTQVLPDLLPLYAALGELPASKARDTARERVDQAKLALEKGDRQGALHALESADRALNLDGIDLPLAAADDALRQAIDQFKEKQNAPSRETLLSVEKNLLTVLNAARPGR